jgi:hypothetical protein
MSIRHIAILKVPIDIFPNGDFKIYEDDLEFDFEKCEPISNIININTILHSTNLEIEDTPIVDNTDNTSNIEYIHSPTELNDMSQSLSTMCNELVTISPSTEENIISEMFNLFVDKSEIKTEKKKRANSSLKNKSHHKKHHYRYSMKSRPTNNIYSV